LSPLLDTGLRIDEALGLESERVDLDALTITIRGKGGRDRIVPISVEGRKGLFRLMLKDHRYVFGRILGHTSIATTQLVFPIDGDRTSSGRAHAVFATRAT
jgi:Phage integrase family